MEGGTKEEAISSGVDVKVDKAEEQCVNECEAEEDEEQDLKIQSSGIKRTRSQCSSEEVESRRSSRRQRLALARTKLLYEPWNSLIIASKFHPSAPTLTLLHFLCPGAPFAVYCPRMQVSSAFDSSAPCQENFFSMHLHQ